VHADTDRFAEDPVGVDIQPRLIDVRCRSDSPIANDRREGTPDTPLPPVMPDEFNDDLCHRLRRCGLRRVDAVAISDQPSCCEINNGRLHSTATDVDTKGLADGGTTQGRHEAAR